MVERNASPPAFTVKVAFFTLRLSLPVMPLFFAVRVMLAFSISRVSLLTMPLLKFAVRFKLPLPAITKSSFA